MVLFLRIFLYVSMDRMSRLFLRHPTPVTRRKPPVTGTMYCCTHSRTTCWCASWDVLFFPSQLPNPPAPPEENSQECGFVFVFKKLLNLLPAFGGEGEDEETSEDLLRYGATQIINLLAPVTICMAVVLLFVVSVQLQDTAGAIGSVHTHGDVYLVSNHPDCLGPSLPSPLCRGNVLISQAGSSPGLQAAVILGYVVVIVVLVIVMTVVLVLLFKYKCYKVREIM